MSTRDEITKILNGDARIPDEVSTLVDSGKARYLRPSGYHEMAACVLILLRKIERLEGELNPEDSKGRKL